MNQRFVLAVLFVSISIASGQEPKKDDLALKPQWQRLLQGDDAKKAAELEKNRDDFAAKDDCETAIRASKELYELRRRLQGDDHFETINEKWRSIALGKVADLADAGRAEWRDSLFRESHAIQLAKAGMYGEAMTAARSRLQKVRDS